MLRPIIFLLCVAGALSATCNFMYSSTNPGVFTRKFGSNTLILAGSNSFTFDDTMQITAYCTSGFKSYSNYETTPLPQIIYSCSTSGVLNYRKPNTSSWTQASNTGALSCASASSYYEARVEGCSDYGLAYGFFIEKQPVILASICYDLNLMKPKYVQYVAGPRTTIVQNQNSFNPGNVTLDKDQPIDVLFDKNDVTAENKALQSAIATAMPTFMDFVNYKLEDILPSKASLGNFAGYTNGLKDTSLVAWWQPLRLGNWRGVEYALEEVSANSPYEVYAGTSGVVTYPIGGKMAYTDRLTYKYNQYTRNVPLYVWNWVRQKNNIKEDGVVIIGVNSPFFQVKNSSDLLCEDICDKIDWLDGISRLRKLPTLGYIYCCNPKDVLGKLENLPHL